MSSSNNYAGVQADIDAIISAGDISCIVQKLSLLFVGVPTVYIGGDNAPHQINYTPFTTSTSGQYGFLPIGTNITPIYTSDPSQDVYSMQPLINYIVAYNALAEFASTLVGGTNDPTNPIPVDYNTYTNFITSYEALVAYYDLFANMPKYNVTLYRYAKSQCSLVQYLNCIKSKIITNVNFQTYVLDFTLDYTITIYYTVGSTAFGLYALSRNVAFNARRGNRIPTSIP